MANQTILITGVTRGLGRALTDEFVRAGHTIIGCGRSETEIAQLRQRFGAPHRFDPLNVAADVEVKAWAESILASHGPPDLLLNNAAVINKSARLWEISSSEFAHVIDINLKGTFHLIRHLVPAMIRKGQGVVVNFSSGWGRSTDAEVAPYCATKWAIEGLTQSFAQELPPGLGAVALNPGIINTEMLQSCFGPSASRFLTPAQWAKTAAPFLLELSAKDNGKQLTVPG